MCRVTTERVDCSQDGPITAVPKVDVKEDQREVRLGDQVDLMVRSKSLHAEGNRVLNTGEETQTRRGVQEDFAS